MSRYLAGRRTLATGVAAATLSVAAFATWPVSAHAKACSPGQDQPPPAGRTSGIPIGPLLAALTSGDLLDGRKAENTSGKPRAVPTPAPDGTSAVDPDLPPCWEEPGPEAEEPVAPGAAKPTQAPEPVPEPAKPAPGQVVPAPGGEVLKTTINPVLGRPYHGQIQVPGMRSPVTYTVTGLVPRGLWISPAGRVSGSPQHAGTYEVAMTVTDVRGATARLILTINVCGTCTRR